MNWEGIQQSSREKVQSLVNAFNIFINENHKGTDPEDQRIKRQWEHFRQLIEKNPADTQSHNKFVLALRNALLKQQVSKNKNPDRAKRQGEIQVRPKITVDKNKLLNISKDLKRATLRNTKDPLDLLD